MCARYEGEAVTNYVGVLDGGGGAWGVRIPDLPGCYGGGATAEAALDDATSAAREWLSQQLGKGAAQPKARALADIIGTGELDPANNEAAVILVAGRTVRGNGIE